jgi:hypothetical protein
MILYSRDRDRTKSHSRQRSCANDDRTAPLSKIEQQSQSESILSSSPMTVPSDQQRSALSSIIEPVIEENPSVPSLPNPSDNIQPTETNSINPSTNVKEESTSNNGKKRKKHHHHKKHRRHRSKSPNSKSKKHHHSKDNDTNPIVENISTNSTPIIEAQ